MDKVFKQHGAFSWAELMTTEPAAAMSFYGKLFGWAYKPFEADWCTYQVVQVEGEEKAGIMPMPPNCENMPPCWGSYVTVDNVDATAQLAVELGGKVLVGPQDIPKVGRFCVIQDPQGAIISAITYAAQCQES